MNIPFSVELRYEAYWTARRLGQIYHWLRSEWRPALLWLGFVGFIAWAAERFLGRQPGTWFQWWNILALAAFLLLIRWAWKARRRLVIEEFLDYTSEGSADKKEAKESPADKRGGATQGLSTLLAVELSRLRALYRAVDEQGAIEATATKTDNKTEAVMKVEDVGESLKSAVSAESKLSLGPLSLPIGALMALFSRMVQGPRIIGSLHKNGEHLILTAQIIGGQQAFSWRVESSAGTLDSTSPVERSAADMVVELAYRIFTDLSLNGSVRYTATASFCDGLKAYRDCLRTEKDRKLKFKQAEKKFIETLTEDQEFDRVYYNLGAVYTKLSQLDAAEVAFTRAINQRPEHWEAYMALAVIRSQQGQHDSVIQLTKRVLSLQPDMASSARAYQGLGLAQRLNGDPKSAIKSRKKAVRLAWAALCLAELKDPTEENAILQIKKLASTCLNDLAVSYQLRADEWTGLRRWLAFRYAENLLRQALFLTPSDDNLYFALGKSYYQWGKYNYAAEEYENALRINPESAELWSYLALVYARQHNARLTHDACQRVLDYASTDNPDELKEINAVLSDPDPLIFKQPEIVEIERAAGIQVFLEELEKIKEETHQFSIPVLNHMRTQYAGQPGKSWEYAHICLALREIYAGLEMYSDSEFFLRRAIDEFRKEHPRVISQQGLHARLALSLVLQGKNDEALKEAEIAVHLSPLRAYERDALARVYFGLNQFEQARDAWEAALLWEPEDAGFHVNIGLNYLKLLEEYRDKALRDRALQQGTLSLQRALALYDNSEQMEKGQTYQLLGLLKLILQDYDAAISNFKAAQVLGFNRLQTTRFLGTAFFKSKAYDLCEEQFQTIIKEWEDSIRPHQTEDEREAHALVPEDDIEETIAYAYQGLALSYAERDVRLDEAFGLIQKAKAMESKVKGEKERLSLQSENADTEGWILFKQGLIDKAITTLEDAAKIKAAPQIYLHLATATERKLEGLRDERQIQSLAWHAQSYCQRVLEMDIGKEYEKEVAKLLSQLQSITEGLKQKRAEAEQPKQLATLPAEQSNNNSPEGKASAEPTGTQQA